MQELMSVGGFFVLTRHALLSHNICISHVKLGSCYVESYRLTCSCAMIQRKSFRRAMSWLKHGTPMVRSYRCASTSGNLFRVSPCHIEYDDMHVKSSIVNIIRGSLKMHAIRVKLSYEYPHTITYGSEMTTMIIVK
jgi:hypothetical protein